MSKVALLLCANASLILEGPTVYVPAGYWKVSGDRVVDTEYSVLTSTSSIAGFVPFDNHFINDNAEKLLKGEQFARVLIRKAGTEPFINVYLDQVSK
jgi:hypothetical protein